MRLSPSEATRENGLSEERVQLTEPALLRVVTLYARGVLKDAIGGIHAFQSTPSERHMLIPGNYHMSRPSPLLCQTPTARQFKGSEMAILTMMRLSRWTSLKISWLSHRDGEDCCCCCCCCCCFLIMVYCPELNGKYTCAERYIIRRHEIEKGGK